LILLHFPELGLDAVDLVFESVKALDLLLFELLLKVLFCLLKELGLLLLELLFHIDDRTLKTLGSVLQAHNLVL